jgi:uncharacterized membrane protein
MNDAHLHLTFNHLPLIAPLIALLVMIGGIIFRSDVIKRTAYAIFIFGAIMTIPAFVSGEGAEEIAEELPGVTYHIIHEHEEVAETFALLSYLLGALSLIGIWSNWKGKSLSKVSTYVTVLLSIVVIFLGKQVGTSGGEIRHTEIRDSYSVDLDEDKDHDEHED